MNSSGSVRVTKSKPDLRMDEITIGLSIELPRALFVKPQLSGTLVIPEEAALPVELPVEMTANVRDAFEAASGMRVELTVVPPGERE